MPLNQVPNEIKKEIFSYLDKKSLSIAASIGKVFNQISQDVWRAKLKNEFNIEIAPGINPFQILKNEKQTFLTYLEKNPLIQSYYSSDENVISLTNTAKILNIFFERYFAIKPKKIMSGLLEYMLAKPLNQKNLPSLLHIVYQTNDDKYPDCKNISPEENIFFCVIGFTFFQQLNEMTNVKMDKVEMGTKSPIKSREIMANNLAKNLLATLCRSGAINLLKMTLKNYSKEEQTSLLPILLHEAAGAGQSHVVKELIEMGVDINTIVKYGLDDSDNTHQYSTPMSTAIIQITQTQNDNIKNVIDVLLKKGADLSKVSGIRLYKMAEDNIFWNSAEKECDSFRGLLADRKDDRSIKACELFDWALEAIEQHQVSVRLGI